MMRPRPASLIWFAIIFALPYVLWRQGFQPHTQLFVLRDGTFGTLSPQGVIALLVVAMWCAWLWIIAHAVLDVLRFTISHFMRRESFVPRSWLFVLAASFWSMLVPSRGQVASAAPTLIVDSGETRSVPRSDLHLLSLSSCAVVASGVIYEIGKRRGNRLRQLASHVQLGPPSATAIRTEVALRATAEASTENRSVRHLAANSDHPIYVPLGICDGTLVYVDIGKDSVVRVCGANQSQTTSIVYALAAAARFTESVRVSLILLDTHPDGYLLFSDVLQAATTEEALGLILSCHQHCVVIATSQQQELAIEQVLAAGASLVTCAPVPAATTSLQARGQSWHLSPDDVEVVPYGLLACDARAIGDLLIDVDRSMRPDASRTISISQRCIEDWNVMVRTLGPVDVQLSDGSVIAFEKSKTKELLAWLTSHRSRPTRSAARTALWEVDVADATFTNVISDARRTLNQTKLISSTEEWLPRTFNDQLPFHVSIVSDGEILESCIARAQVLDPDHAVDVLHSGLELVRDLPFAGTGYLWPDAEGITSQLVLSVITASAMAAELDLQRGDIDGVFWATAKGLQVLGAHEELIALRMRAHALRGDLAGVRGEWQSYERVIKGDSWSNGHLSPKLVHLFAELRHGATVTLSG